MYNTVPKKKSKIVVKFKHDEYIMCLLNKANVIKRDENLINISACYYVRTFHLVLYLASDLTVYKI